MPAMTILSCTAPYNGGGMGQHFSHIVEQVRAENRLEHYFTKAAKPGDEAIATCVRSRFAPFLIRHTPLRWFPGGINHTENDLFDRTIARLLRAPIDTFVGFGGQSLRSFQRARELGAKRLELVAANSHVNNVARLHAMALARYPLESSWLNEAQRRKTLEEYAMADVIHIASEYSMKVFIDYGVSPGKLRRVHYTVDPRYVRRTAKASDDGCFRIVYCGSVTVMKGIPDLLDAFDRFRSRRAELTMVGGTATRGMRRYVEQAIRRDPRIGLCPGDPMPHFQRADVYVHPSYEDNLAYAALEAMNTGVPVIVTADTGMKEYVREGVNGWVVPTGDSQAILDRFEAMAV